MTYPKGRCLGSSIVVETTTTTWVSQQGCVVLQSGLARYSTHFEPCSFEPDEVEVLDGKRLVLEPAQTVISHGIDRDLDPEEILRRGKLPMRQVSRGLILLHDIKGLRRLWKLPPAQEATRMRSVLATPEPAAFRVKSTPVPRPTARHI